MKIRSFAVGLSKARAAYRILSMLLFLLILNTFPRVNFASEDEARSQPVGSAALKSVISSKTNSMKGIHNARDNPSLRYKENELIVKFKSQTAFGKRLSGEKNI